MFLWGIAKLYYVAKFVRTDVKDYFETKRYNCQIYRPLIVYKYLVNKKYVFSKIKQELRQCFVF